MGTFWRKHSSGISSSSSSHSSSSSLVDFRSRFDCQLSLGERGDLGKSDPDCVFGLGLRLYRLVVPRLVIDWVEKLRRGAALLGASPGLSTSPANFRPWCPAPGTADLAFVVRFLCMDASDLDLPFEDRSEEYEVNGRSSTRSALSCSDCTSSRPISSKCATSARIPLSSDWYEEWKDDLDDFELLRERSGGEPGIPTLLSRLSSSQIIWFIAYSAIEVFGVKNGGVSGDTMLAAFRLTIVS